MAYCKPQFATHQFNTNVTFLATILNTYIANDRR